MFWLAEPLAFRAVTVIVVLPAPTGARVRTDPFTATVTTGVFPEVDATRNP